jgi:hypothetical protein
MQNAENVVGMWGECVGRDFQKMAVKDKYTDFRLPNTYLDPITISSKYVATYSVVQFVTFSMKWVFEMCDSIMGMMDVQWCLK